MGKYLEDHQLSAMENRFLFSLNIQSLKAHHDQLQAFLNNFQHRPQIFALSETWLTDNDDISMLKLEGYQTPIGKK